MDSLKEKLYAEIELMDRAKGPFTVSDLEKAHLLTGTIKNILKIERMEKCETEGTEQADNHSNDYTGSAKVGYLRYDRDDMDETLREMLDDPRYTSAEKARLRRVLREI